MRALTLFAPGDPPMPVSSTSLRLLVLPGLALTALTGCATRNPCGDNPEYLAARDVRAWRCRKA